MLSEHEIIELLEQLKLGALHGVASESDPVGHWPVLVGDGLCLSLQSAAKAEFVTQPETVTVISGLSNNTTLAGICSQYRQVHHVSTGLHNRSLLIGYDSGCLGLLPQLHQTSPEKQASRDDELCHSSFTYDFSLAIAASLDPAAHLDGANHPVAFLPLEFDEHVRVAGGWRIALQLGDEQAEFFIGLLNPDMPWVNQTDTSQSVKAVIRAVPHSVAKTAAISEISVVLDIPETLERLRAAESEFFQLRHSGDTVALEKDHQQPASGLSSEAELMVQRSLQLSVDDLYLLLVEAIGGEVAISIAFEFDSAIPLTNDQFACGFSVGKKFRCVSINNLPIRHAEIMFDGLNFRLTSYD